MRFRTKILQSGKTATGFVVPADVVDALGSGKRPKVKVTLKRYSYRNTVAVAISRWHVVQVNGAKTEATTVRRR